MATFEELIARANCSRYEFESPDYWKDTGGLAGEDLQVFGSAGASPEQSKYGTFSLAALDETGGTGAGAWLVQFLGPFTVALWVYRKTNGTHYLAGNVPDIANRPNKGWAIRYDSDGRFWYAADDGTSEGTHRATAYATQPAADGQWNFCAFSCTPGGDLRAYNPDGTLAATAPATDMGGVNTNLPALILNTQALYFAGNGFIDDVTLWAEQLTDEEILTIYNGPGVTQSGELTANPGSVNIRGNPATLSYTPEKPTQVFSSFLLKEVRDYLRADPRLRDLLAAPEGVKIYVGRIPQNVEFPCVVLTELGGPPDYLLDRESCAKRTTIQVDVYSHKVRDAHAAAEFVRLAPLSAFRGQMGDCWILSSWIESDRSIMENPERNTDDWKYRHSADYGFWFLRQQPA